jgi:putative tricarboxylic transport membrane protein
MVPHEAIALLLGALAVISIADSMPANLSDVPEAPTFNAAVLEGYPMAKRGEARRVMGAAFTASVVDGMIGAMSIAGEVRLGRMARTEDLPRLLRRVPMPTR